MKRFIFSISAIWLLSLIGGCNVYRKVTVNGDRSFDYSQ